MGISGLLKFGTYILGINTINDCIAHFTKEFGYKPRIAFDMSVLFHMFVDKEEAKLCYEKMRSGIDLCPDDLIFYFNRLNDFLSTLGCGDIWLVFDGKCIPYKEDTMKTRRATRDKMYEMMRYEQSIETPHNHCAIVKEMIESDKERYGRDFGWKIVEAPGEADAQLYYLQKEDLVDIIATVDSDVIAYGAKRVFFMNPPRYFVKETGYPYPTPYRLTEKLCINELPREVIIIMAWLLGNDYSKGIAKVGQKTLPKILSGCSVNTALDAHSMVNDFIEQYVNSDMEKKTQSIEKTCEKYRINKESVYQQLHLLFKIFRTYPIYDPIFGQKLTLDGRQYSTVDSWRNDNP